MALDQLSDPPLDSLQRINVFPMLGSTDLDIISQIWPHYWKTEGSNHFLVQDINLDNEGPRC